MEKETTLKQGAVQLEENSYFDGRFFVSFFRFRIFGNWSVFKFVFVIFVKEIVVHIKDLLLE